MNKSLPILGAVSLLALANGSLIPGFLGLALAIYSWRKHNEPQRQWRRITR